MVRGVLAQEVCGMKWFEALEDALELSAERGWPVVPRRLDKGPCTKHGWKDASRDHDEIRRMWTTDGVLIGVPTGAIGGFDVLDIELTDEHVEARQWEQDVLLKFLEPGYTLTVWTRRGIHFYFDHQDGLRTRQGFPVRGVDVLADGGSVTWWPATGRDWDDVPIAPWPEALLEAIRPKPKPRVVQRTFEGDAPSRLLGLIKVVQGAAEGERSAVLNWATWKARELIAENRVDKSFVAHWLLRAALHAGLTEKEATATINSTLRGV
jgi:putative DNA primase/helicase